jgi:hypothetical protein
VTEWIDWVTYLHIFVGIHRLTIEIRACSGSGKPNRISNTVCASS